MDGQTDRWTLQSALFPCFSVKNKDMFIDYLPKKLCDQFLLYNLQKSKWNCHSPESLLSKLPNDCHAGEPFSSPFTITHALWQLIQHWINRYLCYFWIYYWRTLTSVMWPYEFFFSVSNFCGAKKSYESLSADVPFLDEWIAFWVGIRRRVTFLHLPCNSHLAFRCNNCTLLHSLKCI